MTTAPALDQRQRGVYRRIGQLFAPFRGRLAIVGLLVVISALLGIANPLLVRAVFDDGLFGAGGARLGDLATLVVALALVAIAGGGVDIASTYLTNQIGQRVLGDLRGTLYGHLQTLSLGFFSRTRGGEVQSRLTNDVAGLQGVITDTASEALEDGVTIISAAIAMLLLSWQLALVSFAVVPVFGIVAARIGRTRRARRQAVQVALAGLTTLAAETLSVSGVLLSKLFGRERDETARYVAANGVVATAQVRQVMVGTVFFTAVQTFFALTPALVYLVAGLVLTGDLGTGSITAGTLVAFTTLQARLFQPVGRVLRTATEVSSSVALFQRIFDYLDLRPDVAAPERPAALPASGVRGEVRYDQVWFAYDPAAPDLDDPAAADEQGSLGEVAEPAPEDAPGRWALRGIDVTLAPGTMTAVVGPSGAGKTTFAYLTPRLYDPTRGSVRLDGVDLRDVDPAALASTVGMVSQDTYLFHGTVRENLAYGRPDATDEEIERAARAANIHDRITSFPDGYQTVVGERGTRLSGGERQRVAIARVILSDPRVLVLDEATSALDTVSERLVQSALTALMRGRTSVVIAHRLSTIQAADRILVVDAGRIVEDGTHHDLLQQHGLYAQLHDQQFGSDELVEAHCADGIVLQDGRVLVLEGAGQT